MRSIAVNTMKFFLRHKTFHIIFVLIVVVMSLSLFVGNLALQESPRFIMNFCLFILEFFSLIVVLFFASQLLSQEKEWKTLSMLLVKISPSQYLLGKSLGFVLFLFLLFLLLSGFYLLLSGVLGLFVLGTVWLWSFVALFLMFLKICVLFSIVLFFSTFISSLSAIFVSLIVYFLSHSLAFLKFYVYSVGSQFPRFLQYFVDAMYFLFPQFEQLSLKDYLFSPVLGNLNFGYFFGLSVSNIMFVFLLLFLSIIVYSRRQKSGFGA